jgi:hypothetical protein
MAEEVVAKLMSDEHADLLRESLRWSASKARATGLRERGIGIARPRSGWTRRRFRSRRHFRAHGDDARG